MINMFNVESTISNAMVEWMKILLGLFELFGKVVEFVKDKRTNWGTIW
jgi:hypothetical protein